MNVDLKTFRCITFIVCVWVIAFGCKGEGAGRSELAIDSTVPSNLVLRYDLKEGVPGPESRFGSIGVNRDGRLAFSGGFLANGDSLIGVLDSAGALVAMFGRQGDGPDEIPGNPQQIWVRNDSILLFYFGGIRAIRKYDLTGTHGGDLDTEPGSFAFLTPVTTSTFLTLDFRSGDFAELGIVELDLETDGITNVVQRGDAYFNEVRWQQRAGFLQWTSWVSLDSRTIYFGDGLRYRIAKYVDGEVAVVFGRDLPYRNPTQFEIQQKIAAQSGRPPERRQSAASIARDSVAYLGPGSLQIDGRRHLWVIGQDQTGGFADVYADTTMIGEFRLEDCRPYLGKASINGDWLAVLCTVEDQTDSREVALRLYKIGYE